MAMNMDALLKIRAQVDGANKIVELNRGLTSVGTTAKGVTGAMRGLTGASAGLSGALGALAPLLSVAGLVGLAKGSLDAGDKMYDLAQRTGVSVEALARFRKAAATSGTDIDAVSKALVKLSKGMVDAAAGSKQQMGAFKALGINIKDSSGQMKSADSVMLEIANRFKAMPDGVAKTALSLKLFGKAGAEMIPMLNMGGDAIDKLSVKMTTAFAEKADAYSDKLAMLSGKVGALGADLLIALLPALDAVTDAVTAGVGAFNSLPGPVKGLAVAGAGLAIAWGPITGLVSAASKVFMAGAAAVGTLRVQLALAAMQEIPALSAAIMLIPGWGWALAGVAALTALGVALYQNSSDFRNWSNNIGTVVVSDFSSAMKAISDNSKSAFDQILKSMKGFNQASVGVANGVGGAFGRMFGSIAGQARAAFANISSTIAKWWNSLPAPVRGAMQKAGSFAGAAAQIATIGPFATYANRANTRAMQTKPKPEQRKKSGTDNGGSGYYSPDLGALSGGSGRGSEAASNKAAADAKRLAEERAKQLLASQKQLAISQAELTINQASSAMEKAAAEYALQKLRIEQDFTSKLKESKSVEEKSNLEAIKRNELEKARLSYLEQQTRELLRQAGIDNPDFGKKPTGIDWKDATKYEPKGEGMAKLDEAYTKIKERLQEMADPANQIIGAANAIGDAFANSFEGMISGAMTAKQALASFFKDLASYFTKMATQMIADALRMAAIKILTNILSSVIGGFTGGGGTDLGKNFNSAGAGDTGIGWGAALNFKRNALGNAYAANGIVPFAAGGIVNRPTFFKFAQGGTMQNGLMGEAGPEGILPLKRGRDGKLGVISSGGGGTTNITIAVDASGTKAEGDQARSGALARDLAAVVDQRLVYHKRPGGILA
jgi:hypothetical protein